MGAFARAIGERVVDEPSIEDRFYDCAKSVMHDPISKGRRGDDGFFSGL